MFSLPFITRATNNFQNPRSEGSSQPKIKIRKYKVRPSNFNSPCYGLCLRFGLYNTPIEIKEIRLFR